MTTPIDLGPAAAEIARLARGVRDDQLAAPTPAWGTVAGLLDHLVGLTVAFRAAAVKEPDVAPGGPAASGGQLAADWRERLPRQLDELAAAWRADAAWTGMTAVGGVTLPGEVAGVVALDELVLHGWDLARGTGQELRCDDASVEVVLGFTASTATSDGAGTASDGGLFGPAVAVPDDAPPLDRALGFAGRDPAWRPPSAG